MALFQSTVVQKYLKAQNQTELQEKWEAYKAHFHDPSIQENIRNAKEEQYQEGFLRDLFVKILGYTLNPATDYNLTTELKNVKDSKKADGGIIVNDKVIGVIELKGTNTTDLSKVETQAFGYKNNQSSCTYVITSNFEKLRFYIDNAIEHQVFNLFELTEEEFKLLYLCLAYQNISQNIPKKVKNDSHSQEDIITKQLYKDYSFFKRELYNNLTELNPDIEALLLFKKSQKLLDRFLFLFFAEDRHLLPPNSVRLILKQWKQLKELDAYTPLYKRFKKYFGYLNTGHKGKQHNVYPYNGGLFRPDEILDNIKIDDELLYEHTLKLSEYDFDSEVDVNILGHIFENSLNEIEEIQTKLEENPSETKVKVSKRKKDGVFYTPKYITKYIVENTVGKLCEEKKTEVNLVEEDYNIKRQTKTKKQLLKKLNNYRDWLLQITVVDPACGSGAFLNEALNYLMAEHQYLDELETKLMGGGFIFPNVENSILEHNLFGVDINNESVEIAKLSLWLRTAQPNRKLNDLSNNIKCGNSLIDDPEVAGDKAFNWENEFPQVFAKGGFDVVIGNPPYVSTKQIKSLDREYFWDEFENILFSEMDLYQLFLFKSVDKLLKKSGLLGFITPNSYYTSVSFKKIRNYILEKTSLFQIIDFPYRFYPFDDVNTETSILLLRNVVPDFNNVILRVVDKKKQLLSNDLFDVYKNETTLPQELIMKRYDGKIIINTNSTLDKLIKCKKKFGDYLELHKGWMSVPKTFEYNSEIIDQGTLESSELKNYNSIKEDFNKYLEGRDIHRYYTDRTDKYVSVQKIDKKTKKWHFSPKIILQRIVGQNKNKIFATIDLENFMIFPNANLVNVKKESHDVRFFIAIINSKLISYFYGKYFGESNTNITKLAFESIPIPDINNTNQTLFISLAKFILSKTRELNELSGKFQRSLQRQFPEELEKLPKKLQDWYELSYANFIKELKKKKIKLSLSQEAEWEEYFLSEQQKATSLTTQINQTDKEIDQMVYELYGLTEEEIEIVENS
ncbi:Eco57I restriction-modification methylase domain-containing protein [Psychroflexus aestuariivivens]|uniref:Eco57I restriction-modification methylase domain-containing protein n=1 Tax=Psychroflexus aestuariivivens TaxID=1795040 RepID=UPI000FD8B23D|nr:DNA methyltransferase [Psychroflexus aestuariivivens]